MALGVLAMVCGPKACEQHWSAYYFVRSKKCNRLASERANNLVYFFTNMRLPKRSIAFESVVEWGKGLGMAHEKRGEVESSARTTWVGIWCYLLCMA